MTRNELDKAGALIKAAGLMEAATSVLAYIVLWHWPPHSAQNILPMIQQQLRYSFLYGVSILGMLTTETATGVLQVGNHYRSQSLINLIQSLVTAGIIFYAYIYTFRDPGCFSCLPGG